MRSPRKNLKARSAVTSRKCSPASPVWTSAKDVFKSPKSPSPVRRVTRRTSVYQSKVSTKDSFKMPLPKIISPPGVKTRARRSSIYQKGGGRLISPKNTRARRASMYISSKSKPEPVNVFSKVWATPVRQPDPVVEKTPEKPEKVKGAESRSASPKKIGRTPRATNKSISKASPSKTVTPRRSVTPKKTVKTPKSVNRSKLSESKAQASKQSPSPKKTRRTPKAVTNAIEIPESRNKSPEKLDKKKSKTPMPSTKQSPTRASPKQLRKGGLSTPGPKSAKKSPKARTGKKSSPVQKETALTKPGLVTSTPTKSVEQITGKSFYATPGETPIPSRRTDEIFVFSAMPVKSGKKSLKKSVHITPSETPQKKTPKTPKRMPTRKTPAVKRNWLNVSADSDVSSMKSPPAKRVKATPTTRTVKSVKRAAKKVTTVDDQPIKERSKLSPVEMSSVLRSVTETEKRKASKSPSPRQTKRVKVEATDLQTPRVIKTVKRSSPKNLAEIVSVSQNTNNNGENGEKSGNMSLLNDTINTDSRSGRCIIL
ncbi:muscle M-line assembly protein unc-89-like [Mercenaria mercenaria]|uniref:muscle M-line assembly protein unc-89-like n=1 Tax=Mercenaria mercenaria TaxID=6596 RepID=UPI001E1D98EC|nr:muscle M-line assembly protein unc-89-like [Mercenaria mercenaria]XP_045188711.1 muscle M-line assembly protein unc-89-like [Mercenaria mercenaria]